MHECVKDGEYILGVEETMPPGPYDLEPRWVESETTLGLSVGTVWAPNAITPTNVKEHVIVAWSDDSLVLLRRKQDDGRPPWLLSRRLFLEKYVAVDVTWLPFDGDGSCRDWCLGWDGASSRCDCGNRRLHWETNDGVPTPAVW